MLTIASATGVLASYGGGLLADRVRPRGLMAVLLLVECFGFAAYTAVRSVGPLTCLACILMAASMAGNAARGAVVARAFDGPDRVRVRAVMRMLTNVGMTGGAALAGVALVRDTAGAYRAVMLVAAAMHAVSAVAVMRLPSSLGDRRSLPDEISPSSRATPLRDRRFLALTALAAVSWIQYGILDVAVPIWVTEHTLAPRAMVSVLLILNTVMVALLQVPLSRGSHVVRTAARLSLWSGVLLAAGCLSLWWAGAVGSASRAVAVLVGSIVLVTLAEIWSSAAMWGLSFELSPLHEAGAYQGVFTMGSAVGTMLAPLAMTHVALRYGAAGWLGVGSALLGVGAATWGFFRGAIPAVVRDRGSARGVADDGLCEAEGAAP